MDIVIQIDVFIDHCPMENMREKVSTKPLQGKALREFQVDIISCPVEYENDEISY